MGDSQHYVDSEVAPSGSSLETGPGSSLAPSTDHLGLHPNAFTNLYKRMRRYAFLRTSLGCFICRLHSSRQRTFTFLVSLLMTTIQTVSPWSPNLPDHTMSCM